MMEKAKLDAVSVCTFDQGHREPTVDVLERGLYGAPREADGRDARRRQGDHASGRKQWACLMVGFQPFFRPITRQPARSSRPGALGDIYYAETVAHRRWGIPGGNFVRKASAGAGSLVDIGVYAIHEALTLMTTPTPVTVSAITGNHLAKGFQGVQQAFGGSWTAEEFEVEEFAAGFVRFANGASLTLKSAWASNIDSMGRSFFLGTKAGLALDPLELYVNQMINRLNFTAAPKSLRPVDDWAEKVKVFAEHVRDGGHSRSIRSGPSWSTRSWTACSARPKSATK